MKIHPCMLPATVSRSVEGAIFVGMVGNAVRLLDGMPCMLWYWLLFNHDHHLWLCRAEYTDVELGQLLPR